jgi:FtsP/CotA-like multicopper oxidase with cupredoxin domain
MNLLKKIILFFVVSLPIISFSQKVVHYELFVRDTMVNYTGKTVRAIAVNGQIPMPTLTFTEGDTAEIVVHNLLKESTSLHWHGLILPYQEDGVPYLTQMPIKPNEVYTYRFPIKQHGTHWYHSHSGLQEQLGMYGAFILNKKQDEPTFRAGIDDLPTYPILLGEWTNLNPYNIHRMLHNANDWFSIKKGATQSYAEAIKQGHFKTKIANEWKRMLAMDVSDIYYDKVFFNGKDSLHITSTTGQKQVRLQISNAGASTYFWLNYSGGKITIVANDGNDVEPVEVDRLIVPVAETYDVILTIPDTTKMYELRATSEDRTQTTTLFVGNGALVPQPKLPKLNYFAGMKMMNGMMKMNGNLDDNGMEMSLNQMDMNTVMYEELKTSSTPIKTFNYALLTSTIQTTLSDTIPTQTFHFVLTGNMNRYVWSMDNKVLSETDKLYIKQGEKVRMIIYNNSMMRHPMHIHGHDFRLINGKGAYSPLKNTVDIMPMETDTLEFEANNSGDWIFHCHILYHMMSGMGKVFTYENKQQNKLITNPSLAQRKLFSDDRRFRLMVENDFATNGNDGKLMYHNTRWNIGSEWRLGYDNIMGYEIETHIGRYVDRMQFFMPFIGFDWRKRQHEGQLNYQERNIFNQSDTKDRRTNLSIGFDYKLPMLITLQAELFTNGYLRFQLERDDIPISKRIRGGFMWNTDKEYMVDVSYILNRFLRTRVHYDSDMGIGFGLLVHY